MKEPAAVSIVTPVKDRAHLLEATLNSLRAQTYRNWRSIVVDDASTSGEFEFISKICAGDSRIRLMRNPGPRRGASASRNAGFAASDGAYVVFLDSDDLLAPTCLERRVAALELRRELDFAVFPTWQFRSEPGDTDLLWHPFAREDDLDRFLTGPSAWQTAGPLWRREALERLGPWDERALSWQDWEYHVRAIASGLKYEKFPDPDSYWRMTAEDSVSRRAHTRRYEFNRARVYSKAAVLLDSKGLFTERRRKSLAAHFFRLAFRKGHPSRVAFAIWTIGHRSRTVSAVEFYSVFLCESAGRMARWFSYGLERILFPWN